VLAAADELEDACAAAGAVELPEDELELPHAAARAAAEASAAQPAAIRLADIDTSTRAWKVTLAGTFVID
jgi:hypothetical protein